MTFVTIVGFLFLITALVIAPAVDTLIRRIRDAKY